MNICEIIDSKKNGKALSKEQIDWWIKGIVDGTVADYQTSALLMACVLKGLNSQESYFLTMAICDNGHKIDLSKYGELTCDKHSSGGVGDTTTFVVLPIVVACGLIGAKTSGRSLGHTGGTLDKLESIKSLSTTLSEKDFLSQIDILHIAIVGQTKEICPADKIIYAIRDVTSTVDSIGLIASSIMSKKLACGSKNIVLDVKCGCGAFMKSLDDASELAELMVDIGKKADRNISALVTNMDFPLSNFVGNALEVYGAIKVLKNKEKGTLYELSVALAAKLLQISGIIDAEKKVLDAIESGEAYEVFAAMLLAQGAEKSIVENEEKLLSSYFKQEIIAKESGFVKSIDALQIAKFVCSLGGGRKKIGDEIDPTVGVHLSKNIGDKVEIGEILATIYHNDKSGIEQNIVLDAFKISFEPVEKPILIYKIIE